MVVLDMENEWRKIRLSDYEPDEVIIGKHESGIMLEEGMRLGIRNYCARCKRNVHCHVVVDNKEARVKFTCTNDGCECKCRTHFACKKCGYLHPYGEKCTRTEKEMEKDPKADEAFDKMMEDWRESKKVEEPKGEKK